MEINEEIILQKYSDELSRLKHIFLKSSVDEMSNLKFLDMLKFVLSNTKIKDEDFNNVSNHLNCSITLLKDMHKAFHHHHESINILNFEFPKYILKKPIFANDKSALHFILDTIKSSYGNEKIIKDLELTDLISKKALNKMESFLSANLFEKRIKENFAKFFDELTHEERYRVAMVRLRKESINIITENNKLLQKLRNFNKYYVKLLNPFVAIHDINTLKEIITIKSAFVEVEYV